MNAKADNILQRVALGSIGVGFAVLGLKLLAWRMTGSVALFSDAMESIVNVAASAAAYMAIRFSTRPPDRRHPYGHTKIEYFSAVFVGVLIILAALSIGREAYAAFLSPKLLDEPMAGIVANALAGIVNAVWCWLLLRVGRAHSSPALLADGKHLFSDVISSFGVLLGVGLAVATGWTVLDPLLAGLVAVNVLFSGWRLIQSSLGALMDESVDDKTMQAIAAAIAAEGEGALQAHEVKTRRAGCATFVEFHLVVPSGMSVGEAHMICDRLEAAIRNIIKGAAVTIHVEPPEKAQQHGAVAVTR
ncbi:MAG: cation diffusion facilitator family transporter [Bosea sp. (in: a-proteobacteria)]